MSKILITLAVGVSFVMGGIVGGVYTNSKFEEKFNKLRTTDDKIFTKYKEVLTITGDGLACGSEIDSVGCYNKVANDLDKMLPNITELKYERDNLIK